MAQDRRTFLKTLGIAAAAAATPGMAGAFMAPERGRLSRIGIQLYTVRRAAQTNLSGVLAQLAGAGYKEVELAGYYNRPATEFAARLKDNGFAAPSGHIAIDLIEKNPAATFADAHAVGHEWITVPSLPRGKHQTEDDWKRVAAQFNAAAAKAKADGFRFAFHNHNDIVRTTDGVLPIDILMRETDPALVSYQMDIFWAVSGGADPRALLAKYPGRFRMFHVKDGVAPYTDASQTDVGKGTIDFAPIFAAGAGVEHYFVESDSAADPMAFAESSRRYLSNLNF
jgi:sugar phosphate isomerase/epimerase